VFHLDSVQQQPIPSSGLNFDSARRICLRIIGRTSSLQQASFVLFITRAVNNAFTFTTQNSFLRNYEFDSFAGSDPTIGHTYRFIRRSSFGLLGPLGMPMYLYDAALPIRDECEKMYNFFSQVSWPTLYDMCRGYGDRSPLHCVSPEDCLMSHPGKSLFLWYALLRRL
jgi:hypothetical protein